VSQTSPQVSEVPVTVSQTVERAPRARDLAAKKTGISGRTVAEYKRVTEQAPDLIPAVDSGEMKLRRAGGIFPKWADVVPSLPNDQTSKC